MNLKMIVTAIALAGLAGCEQNLTPDKGTASSDTATSSAPAQADTEQQAAAPDASPAAPGSDEAKKDQPAPAAEPGKDESGEKAAKKAD